MRIKSKLILLISSAMCGLCANAENHYKPHISVGVHGGMDLSRVAFSPSVLQKWGNGPIAGFSVRYAEEKLVGILAEFNIETRGWQEDFEESPLEYHRALTYFSVPVMTHIYFGSDRAKCFFNLGPQFSYLISEKTTANFDYTNPYAYPEWPEDPRMVEQLEMPVKNKFDYGICAGVGFEFYVRPRHSVYLECRYYYGLGNIFPSTKADTFSASRNSSLSVTIGYNFRLK